MKWFTAHILMYFELKTPDPGQGDQSEFVVWENVVILSGNSLDEVFEKARKRGQADERNGGDDLTWEGRPVRMVFGGLRKIVECDSEIEGALSEGDELTYSEMKVQGSENLRRLISGEKVQVLLE